MGAVCRSETLKPNRRVLFLRDRDIVCFGVKARGGAGRGVVGEIVRVEVAIADVLCESGAGSRSGVGGFEDGWRL